jgi:hypothetical protein
MATCPACGTTHDQTESITAQNVLSGQVVEIGTVCSLDCLMEILDKLDPPGKCPGCPNCQPMKFMTPSREVS